MSFDFYIGMIIGVLILAFVNWLFEATEKALSQALAIKVSTIIKEEMEKRKGGK